MRLFYRSPPPLSPPSLTHCTAQLYMARGPKRIDVHLAHIRCASSPLSLFFGRGTGDLNWHSGAFFAELADALAVPAFSHRLALYVGHDGTLVRLLAGLGVVPLRWPAFGAEVVIEVRLSVTVQLPVSYLIRNSAPRSGRLSACASYACFMRALYSAEWNGCGWTILWAG